MLEEETADQLNTLGTTTVRHLLHKHIHSVNTRTCRCTHINVHAPLHHALLLLLLLYIQQH